MAKTIDKNLGMEDIKDLKSNVSYVKTMDETLDMIDKMDPDKGGLPTDPFYSDEELEKMGAVKKRTIVVEEESAEFVGGTNKKDLTNDPETIKFRPVTTKRPDGLKEVKFNPSIDATPPPVEEFKSYPIADNFPMDVPGPVNVVVLPHAKFQLCVRGLSVREEDHIRGSGTSPRITLENLHSVIYDCIESKYKQELPNFQTYNNFVNNISSADRDAILIGIMMTTYDVETMINVTCGSCNTKFEAKYNMMNSLNFKPYKGMDNIITKRVMIEIPEFNWKIYLKLPSLADELSIVKNTKAEILNDKSANYIFVDKIETVMPLENGREAPYTARRREEVYGLISNKPAKYRKILMKKWEEEFGEHGISILFKCMCPSCGEEIEISVVPMNQMFQLVGS